jgi:hypothetical protein
LLVEQEEGDVWKLSIGNLPPQAIVIVSCNSDSVHMLTFFQIKFTYVTELGLDDDNVVFLFPSFVNPFSVQNVHQNVISSSAKLFLEIGIEMPYVDANLLCYILIARLPDTGLRKFPPKRIPMFKLRRQKSKQQPNWKLIASNLTFCC